MAIVVGALASSMLGCTSKEQETPPMQSRAAENVSPEMRDAAMNLGVNLINYAFNQWDEQVAKKRK